jgi:hypothetical protein
MSNGSKINSNEDFFELGRGLAEEFLLRLRDSGRGGNTEYQRALLFFFSKAYKTYQAVASLNRQGFVEDAHSLARGVYEIRLQVIYMSGDPEVRSKQFFDHWVRSTFGTLQIVRRLHPDKLPALEQGEKEIREGAEAMGRIDLLTEPEAAERSIKKKWWGGSIKSLLEALNADLQKKCDPATPEYDYLKEYDVIYSQLSDHAHAGLRTLHMFLTEESYRPIPRKQSMTVAWSAMDWLSQIVGHTSAAFDLAFDSTVLEAQLRARKILRPEE